MSSPDRPAAAPGVTLAGEARPVRPVQLWFGLLGGLVAWVLHLGVSYAAVPFVCGTAGEWILHLITVGAVMLAGGAVAAGWKGWRRLERVAEDPDLAAPEPGGIRARREEARARSEEAGARGGELRARGEEQRPAPARPPTADPVDPAVRMQRFMALAGVLLSGFFLFLILVEGLPALIQGDPCRHVPLRDQPIIMVPGGEAEVAVASAGLSVGAAQLPQAASPPSPFTGWNFDPWILFPLYLVALGYLTGVARLWRRAGRGRGIPPWRVACYLGGIAALVTALVSPVDAIAEALFSVHMVQHLLLMVVAAPLIVLGRPSFAFLWTLPMGWRRGLGQGWVRSRTAQAGWRSLTHPVAVLVLHVGALWAWHVPALYEAALRLRWVHHLEHASFFGTALLFWWVLARAGRRGRWPGYGAGVLYVFATALQSGALGALLLFAPEPWYPAHGPGAAVWGVDLLADQQLAGVLMWVPPGVVYALAAALLLVAWMRESEEAVERRERLGWDIPGPSLHQRPEGESA
jgi:putative membrane protein